MPIMVGASLCSPPAVLPNSLVLCLPNSDCSLTHPPLCPGSLLVSSAFQRQEFERVVERYILAPSSWLLLLLLLWALLGPEIPFEYRTPTPTPYKAGDCKKLSGHYGTI